MCRLDFAILARAAKLRLLPPGWLAGWHGASNKSIYLHGCTNARFPDAGLFPVYAVIDPKPLAPRVVLYCPQHRLEER